MRCRFLPSLGQDTFADEQLCARFKGGLGLADRAVYAADLHRIHFENSVSFQFRLGDGVNAADAVAAGADVLFHIFDMCAAREEETMDAVVPAGSPCSV